ncbi:MAG TPA: TetR/AcrR family transcriptional regulator [Nevskiaceae bacterium]|nr:TetR/AcrR family transcriptional regulator [Nevskiaceae bacterium]
MSVGSSRRRPARAAHLGPERRRPQVLDAALKLTVAHGLRSVNMESVADAVGVTKPAVYACFASREDLLAALLTREEQRLVAGVLSALPAELDLRDPERLMVEGFRALLTVVESHADSWRLVLASETDPAVAQRYREARKLVAGRVAFLMNDWLRRRRIRDAARRSPVLVEAFMSLCESAIHAMLDNPRDWTADELGAYYGRLALGAFQNA